MASDIELGKVLGRFDTFEKTVATKLDDYREDLKELFQAQEEQGKNIAVIDARTKNHSRLFWIIPGSLFTILTTAVTIYLKYF